MRWWGWGEDGHEVSLPGTALELLRNQLGVDPSLRLSPVALEDVRLPEPRLAASARERLVGAVGADHVRDDRLARVEHAAGKGYADLVRLRSGDASSAPDLVVQPASDQEIQAVLAACADARIAVVPFGGGTSVVGGVEPVSEGFAGAIALDLRRLTGVTVDRLSQTATLAAGLLGPEAERRLAAEGVTLGHAPQSFEYSTVGGWVATRSAGQASTGYGRIDELVEGVRLIAPAGELAARAVPASAAGPDLRELVVGSEGILGVISEATLRVRPMPLQRRYEGWSFRSFEEGCEAFRVMEQAGASPDVARLSDAQETSLSLATGRAEAPPTDSDRPICACAGTRAGAWRSSGSRARRTTWSAGACAAPRCCARAAASGSAADRGRPGCAGATRAPTCATPCSTTG